MNKELSRSGYWESTEKGIMTAARDTVQDAIEGLFVMEIGREAREDPLPLDYFDKAKIVITIEREKWEIRARAEYQRGVGEVEYEVRGDDRILRGYFQIDGEQGVT